MDHPHHRLIKWTGSKRRTAAWIVARFPRILDTYFEPFLGGGAVLDALLDSDIEVARIECSDICEPLIAIWRLVQADPRPLVDGYAEHRRRLGCEGAAHFDNVRQRFNETGDPILFYFLLRTCRLGHVRLNRRGEFNVGYPAMPPDRVRALAERWHARLQARDVRFVVRDYREVHTLSYDVAYLDPPFATGEGRYYQGGFDHAGLFDWLSHQRGACLLSLNGYLGDADRRLDVPPDLFDQHLLLDNGLNTFDCLGGETPRPVTESLYVRTARILSRSC